jgi:uncharacterized membrane protein YcaP (DUF421 family)
VSRCCGWDGVRADLQRPVPSPGALVGEGHSGPGRVRVSLVALRLFGRRELGQFTAFDLVVLLTLSNILQNAMIGDDSSLLGGLIGAGVLLSANFGLAYGVFRSKMFQRFVTGQPRILIRDGVVEKQSLVAQRLTEQDLLAAVRNEGLEDFGRVHLAISEPNGTISVIPKRDG